MPARGGKHGGSFSREGTRRKEDLRGEGNRRPPWRAMLGTVPGKSPGASCCPWQQCCVAAMSVAPRSGSSAPVARRGGGGGDGEMAFNPGECWGAAFRDALRLQHGELPATHGVTVPAWGPAALLPSTRLLLKRQEVAEVERALQSQREEFRQRMERLEQRRQRLGRREEELRDIALKFNAFFKASAARREREDSERARAAEQDAEAACLRRELEGLLRRRESLARRLRTLRVFSEYLQGVLARSGQFQDVPAMLAHFGALAGARAALARRAAAGREQLAQGRARLQRYRDEAGSEVQRTSAELSQLRARLEAARRDVLQGHTATQKTLLLGQIKLTVLNLFQLATAWLKVPANVALEDTEAQLDAVSAALCPRGRMGTAVSLDGHGTRLPSPQVLLCMQDLAAVCTELRPGDPAPCPPRSPAAARMRPLRRGGPPKPGAAPRGQPPAPGAGGRAPLGYPPARGFPGRGSRPARREGVGPSGDISGENTTPP
ncbi:cilia- and flagella-associated protein 73 isoform X2 [Opisthocomus hoazin]|uniref:cilia- and flagella-associated protein 73 isoform X2 n=1 Tax=Opisthocomus hoazin TaxID=30419 RepID=UPI003F53471C